ncbi:hypothetical protein TNCT_660531 [Trichonephila clavata]|uniref:PiggyBac transposable element-derived protein domain-containing protein n=1 Tax=Trichonephila clavata TaxID=2740835 RepID=A0A8X6LI76_TRICU|nr:hypothetical protein TNCT_660531 [Trichonephila clavata]
MYYGRNSLKQFILGKPQWILDINFRMSLEARDIAKIFLSITGFCATGTIRENRINHEVPVEESAEKERGPYEFAFDKNSEIFLVRRNGNNTVNFVTNFSALKPFFDVKRSVRGHKDKNNVKMRNLINSYNKHMGGVDYHDWLAGLIPLKFVEKVVLATFYTFTGYGYGKRLDN